MDLSPPVRLLLPVGLELPARLRDDLSESAHGYAAWAVGEVVAYPRRVYGVSADDFVPLASEHLRSVATSRWSAEVVRVLLSSGVLEWDGKPPWFVVDDETHKGGARCFRLAAEFRGRPLEEVSLDGRDLGRKVHSLRGPSLRAEPGSVLAALRARVNELTLTPDAPSVGTYALQALRLGHRYCERCDQGRVHHPLTNLRRDERGFVRLAGEELESTDIRNSQPLILAFVLAGNSLGGGVKVRPANRHPPKDALRHRVEDKLSRVLGRRHACERWAAEYLADCRAAVVYERVEERVTKHWRGYEPPPDREEVKKLLLAVVYGRPEHMGTAVGRALDDLYPGLLTNLQALAGALRQNDLPRYLQAVESDLMIQGVADRLVVEHPEIPFLTIHDSIVAPPSHTELVTELIRAVWHEGVGFAPLTKTTPFC